MKLIFASNNAHKLEEARAILKGIEVLSLNEIGCHEEIPETHPTLEGNSLQKAEYILHWCEAHATQLPADLHGCFADDTGLEIEALNGDPGVYTARWAGEHCNPADNRKKALHELQGVTNRAARFRTVVTLIEFSSEEENGEERFREVQKGSERFEGIVRGSISMEERGDGGFGYDPVFIPEGYEKTFAELPITLKNDISHRAKAMQKLADYLKK